MSVGGFGGTGGIGGNVTVSTLGAISTTGSSSDGILAQSVGGGGGNGGSSSSTTADAGDANVSMTVGGFAGSGQTGGTVTVTAGSPTVRGTGNATIQTGSSSQVSAGANSIGLLAQSIGGGGGTGGSSLSSASSGNVAAGFTLGGSGGAGGAGGAVTVYPYANIVTYGSNASAIEAQSVGGGGGSAGSATFTGSGGNITTNLTIGGAGSGGGAGGTVTVLNANAPPSGTGATGASATAAPAISTSGANAYGIFAQSVGGGGGSGGTADAKAATGTTASGSTNASIALGGAGSGGGYGGAVTATLGAGSISTSGSNAVGVLAQSIGGGGGVGASSESGTGTATYQMSLALGGSGGTGGLGGAVTVTNGGAITTTGSSADAMLVQSIGGGGGVAKTTASTTATSGSTLISLALGGSGGTAQTGGTVTANNTGTINTSGALANGMVVQSIGGGGGASGTVMAGGGSTTTSFSGNAALGASGGAGGNGGSVIVNSSGKITTSGLQSSAIMAQSVGGGGGLSGTAVAQASSVDGGTSAYGLMLGQTGGGAGNGGAVNVTVSGGTLTTNANSSTGIFAQSVGGGGGNSTSPVSTSLLLGSSSGGTGGAISVSNGGKISTKGSAAVGILAQSVGGGGGVAVSSAAANETGYATLGGSLNQPASNGGGVTVTSYGTITTAGSNSVGILAQSVGGGGGVVLSPGTTVKPTLNPGNGNGGSVMVYVDAAITTSGAGAYGVIAESVGGGGGLVQNGNAYLLESNGGTGTGGAVAIYAYANITANGQGAVGTYSYSTTDPTVFIAPGVSVSGGPGGIGVLFDGPINLLDNQGSVFTLDGGTGNAVQALSGVTTINNSGTLLGSIHLAPADGNVLNNLAGGTLLAGPTIDLGGNGNLLINAGTLASGASPFGQTAITGSLVQTRDGVLLVRVDTNAGRIDQFLVSGTARLSGAISPVLLNTGQYMPGTVTTPFLTATGGVSLGDAYVSGGSAIIHYGTLTAGDALSLITSTQYTPAGLSGAAWQVGQQISAIEMNPTSSLMQQIVRYLVTVPDVTTLSRAYETVGGEGVSAVPQVTLQATQMAMNIYTDRMDAWRIGGLNARQVSGRTDIQRSGGGEDKPVRIWMSMVGMAASDQNLSGTTFGGAMGVDGEMPEYPVLIGAALNLSQSIFNNSAPGSTINATNFGLSGYSVGRIGDGYLSGIAYVGGNGSGFDRNLYALGLNLQSSARFNSTVAAARVEGGWRFEVPESPVHITPYLAIQPTQVWQGGASEIFGGSGAGLSYKAASITALPMNLGFQLDGKWQLSDVAGESLEPFLRLAWMHDFMPDRRITRSFAELPSQSFSTPGKWNVSDAALIRAGMQVHLSPQTSLFASVDSTLSPTYRSIGGVFGLQYSW